MTDDAAALDDVAGYDGPGSDAAGYDAVASNTLGSDAAEHDAAGDDAGNDDFVEARREGQRIERARIVAYLAKHEASAKAAAATVLTEESRVYQTTIAKAMTAMREAIAGEFHWRGEV
jgi:hypothetical protein